MSARRKLAAAAAATAIVGLFFAGPSMAKKDPMDPKDPHPVTKIAETTKPGEARVSAIFRNGKVYKVKTSTRTYRVKDAAGVEGTLIEDDTNVITQGDAAAKDAANGLPPIDPAYDGVKPTPEQERELYDIAGLNPDGSPKGVT